MHIFQKDDDCQFYHYDDELFYEKQVESMIDAGRYECKQLKVDMNKYNIELFAKAISNKKIMKLKLKASNDQKKFNALTYLLVASCILDFISFVMYKYIFLLHLVTF